MKNRRVEEEREGENERERKRRGAPNVGSHPHVRNNEKYPDCRTDLIGGGGATTQTFATIVGRCDHSNKSSSGDEIPKRGVTYHLICLLIYQ